MMDHPKNAKLDESVKHGLRPPPSDGAHGSGLVAATLEEAHVVVGMRRRPGCGEVPVGCRPGTPEEKAFLVSSREVSAAFSATSFA